MALTDEGTVLSFGTSKDFSGGVAGQLGHGDVKVQLEPKEIEALREMRVVAIATCHWHSVVVTDEGAVLSFGHGDQGQLGHGNPEDLNEPKVIEALRCRVAS